METQSIIPQVVVEQSAVLQLLDVTLHIAGEGRTDEMSQLVHDLRNRYREYQELRHNFLTTRPVLDELAREQYTDVTESDIKKLFSSDEYEEFKDHVQAVEKSFQLLTKSIQLEGIKAKWTRRLRHPITTRTDSENRVITSYSDAVETLHTLDFSVQEEKDTKFMENAREIVEIFNSHVMKDGSKWKDFQPLKARVRIVEPELVTERLETIGRDLKAIARLIRKRQLYPRPNFEKQTYGVAWKLGPDPSDRNTVPANHSGESSILPESLRRYELLVEVRCTDNSKQQEVPREDFGPKGKYRGICKLFITCYAQNFPGNRYILEGSGWLIDDRTVVTTGHCAYSIQTSNHRSENLGIIRAVDIEVRIGYTSAERCPTNVESRRGEWVVTHHEWYDKQEKDCDIAMIRLRDAFEHPERFPYVKTPEKGENEMIYVVGYPADIPPHVQQTMPNDSAGGVMYQSSRAVTWNLNAPSTGLMYRADTYAGNSGGPVLRRNKDNILEVIGVHAGGDQATGVNSATLLGHYGNHLPTFLDALNKIQDNAFANARFCDDKVEGWPQVQIFTLPYVTIP
ncbi:hypothetical protein GQX73_g10229 [Xylaria multiplex]|uniref:Serine protease n=1 Tax=Xylaria multiplex TaxID=323545 RepID=A0A7C8IKI2_9PEZI|nr:hypothetical protein GQX73_g10229 [Xylaria multiplex]